MRRNSTGTRRPKAKQPSAPPAPVFVVSHIAEPKLEFAYSQKVEYPRDGLFLFGPCDAEKRPSQTRFGVIGTAEGVKRFAQWSEKMRGFIAPPVPGPRSREVEPQHVPFPGFQEAFHSEWPQKPVAVIEDITLEEIKEKLFIQNRHEAIHGCVDLYVSRLIKEENRLEAPPAFWFVVIPEVVYELGRPQSRVPRAEALPGEIQISQRAAQDLKRNSFGFVTDYDLQFSHSVCHQPVSIVYPVRTEAKCRANRSVRFFNKSIEHLLAWKTVHGEDRAQGGTSYFPAGAPNSALEAPGCCRQRRVCINLLRIGARQHCIV
jgi:hypothetical protein